MLAMARWAATPEHLRQRECGDRVDDRRPAGRERERDEQLGAPLSDDVVDEILRAGGQDETGKPVDQHQDEPQRQTPSMRPDELPRLGPGVRDVRLSLLGSGTGCFDAEFAGQASASRHRVSFRYLIRCGWSAAVPRRRCRSAS